ncbi:2Fe-2S iron-sulfur cluster binding domain-containing protein [candidate division WOR-3 bacterium]|uniref:2Fe-2S iron-sulfur cluster binding domain-containing protein n=1 Tax=candidate division WOR-3 bacterium TaxID=2052148 RepID=A0A9D5K959_UNCW3|nr:2Fe-2S iron-sulfur cluster binding domain-containing protein [candidate division WOR-3 bacterium]MBD3363874.1 2Fe-2S iron-sulfur cluster binding domain-containing protein [candidate division WOR-3 bacterium]
MSEVLRSALISVGVISGVGAFLALLLVIAERFIANYGEVKIDINKGDKELTVQGGGSLLETLASQKIFIPSACGGRGTCAYCKVKVAEGVGPILPTEEPYLDDTERKEGVRLACQVKVRQELKIAIPEELLAIKEYNCVCERIKDLTYDIKELRLKLPEPMKYTPGQYIQFRAPKYKGSPGEVYRAYSISSDPKDEGYVELVIRKVPGGICTTYIFEHLAEGDEILINGPYGEFGLTDTRASMIFIAGGSGIAPIKCLLHQIANDGVNRKGIFFFGVRALKDLFMTDEMEAFEKEIPDFRFVPALSQPEEKDDWKGETGRITEVVARYLDSQKDASEYEGYLCGSPGMIDASVAVLTDSGIPAERIFYDKFA